METRANYALIGAFTLAVIVAAFGFVFWFSGGDRAQRRQPIRIVFSGPVSGLSKGSNVSFNGLRIGEVTEVGFMPDDPKRVLARIEVDRTTPIRTDTRARLEVQMLSGVAQIALVGGEPSASPLAASPSEAVPTIYADRSDFADLMETARNLARRADDVLGRVDRIVADNEASITRTLQNVERFSQALGENAPGLDKFLAQVGQAAERIGPLAAKLETLVGNVDEWVKSVDRQRVAHIIENVEGVTKAIADNKQNIDTALQDATTLMRRLNETAPKLDTALTDLSKVAGAIDPAKLGRTIDNAERFSASLGNSSQDVEKAIGQAASLTEKLNKSADRVDNVLKAAESFLGSGSGEEGKGAFASVRQAADAIRALATNLDKRTAELTAGLTRFTGSGLRDVQAATGDARKTLNDVSRTVRSVERNPQQFLFGNRPSIPEYNGGR